jgi:FtsH-binding integral membrane protein
MTTISDQKPPRVFYVIIGFAALSLLMMLATAYMAFVSQTLPNYESNWMNNLSLVVPIILAAALIALLLMRKKAALYVVVIQFLIIAASAASTFLLYRSGSVASAALIGNLISVVFYLLVVLKIWEFSRSGLLR